MSTDKRLSIDDLEPADTLTDEELRQVSAGTLKPDGNGFVKVTRDGKTVIVKPIAVEVLTPTEFGRV